MAIVRRTAQVAVTDVATLLVSPGTSKSIVGFSVTPSADIFIGASDVTATTGIRVQANVTYSEAEFAEAVKTFGAIPTLYGIRATAGTTTTYVGVLEASR